MNRIKEILARRFDLQLDPETVERAGRRDRVKRGVWLFASNILAGTIVVALMLGGLALELPPGLGPAVVCWFLLDQCLFGWGVDRFDLVPPWQFREEAGGEE